MAEPTPPSDVRKTRKLPFSLRVRLSVLWMLQWAVTGSLFTYLPIYFADRGLSQQDLGILFAVAAIGLWVAPVLVGQVCDRLVAAEKYLALSHFTGGLTLLAVPFATDIYAVTGQGFWFLATVIGLFAAAYFPTLPVVSAVTFRHLPDPERQFGRVRLWGTVGWVLAGLFVSFWLGQRQAFQWLANNSPALREGLSDVDSLIRRLAPPEKDDCFRLAAVLSFALSSFCAWLPKSPPPRATSGRFAPLSVLRMMGDPEFALIVGASFLVSLAAPVYSLQVPALLIDQGYDPDWVPAVLTVGQVSEFPALLLLALFLKRLGTIRTFLIGTAAWAVRYGLLAAFDATGPVLTAVALHGVCHVFLIVTVQLYVDARCPPDLRASVQNLFAVLTVGVGTPLGFLLAGALADWGASAGHASRFPFAAAAVFVLAVLLPMAWVVRRRGRSTVGQAVPDAGTDLTAERSAPSGTA